MRLGRGGSINNLYAESLSCEIAIFFLRIFIISSLESSVSDCSGFSFSTRRLKERIIQKCKTIFNSFFEGETNAQLSLGNTVRSI